MKFDFRVIATKFASICAVISAAGFFLAHPGVGWGFAVIAVAAFFGGLLLK